MNPIPNRVGIGFTTAGLRLRAVDDTGATPRGAFPASSKGPRRRTWRRRIRISIKRHGTVGPAALFPAQATSKPLRKH